MPKRIRFEDMHTDREDWRFFREAVPARAQISAHTTDTAEVRAVAAFLQLNGITHTVLPVEGEWRKVCWLLTGERNAVLQVYAMRRQPRWTYGGGNYGTWLGCNRPRFPMDGTEAFTGAMFDHWRLFTDASRNRRMLMCMDYPEDDRRMLKEMAGRYGLHHAEFQTGSWASTALSNFEMMIPGQEER